MSPIAVLSVASEIYPLVKTGGLADVAGARPLRDRAPASSHQRAADAGAAGAEPLLA